MVRKGVVTRKQHPQHQEGSKHLFLEVLEKQDRVQNKTLSLVQSQKHQEAKIQKLQETPIREQKFVNYSVI